jgi:Icc-related predicted phosphoesterase
MRLLAFSDWGIQPIEDILHIAENLKPDFAVYCGDHTSRFKEKDKNYLSILASMTKQKKVLVVLGNDDVLYDNAIENTMKSVHVSYGDENTKENILKILKTLREHQKTRLNHKGTKLPVNQNTRLNICISPKQTESTSAQVLSGDGIYNLHQKPFIFQDYAFIGLGGQLGTAFFAEIKAPPLFLPHHSSEKRDEEAYQVVKGYLDTQLAKVEKDKKIIIISHAPPYGVLDIGLRLGQNHIGSRALRDFIEGNKVALALCGHCHLFGGRAEQLGTGYVINCASHDYGERNDKEEGIYDGNYAVIEIQDSRVSYELCKNNPSLGCMTKLNQVGPRRIQHMLDAGIRSLEDVSEQNRKTIESLPGSSKWHADMWIRQVKAIQSGKFEVFDRKRLIPLLGIENPAYFDIETDLGGRKIWLIGIYNERKGEFLQFFEKDREDKLLQDFSQYVIKNNCSLICYGGNYFDRDVVKNSMREHGIKIPEYIEQCRDAGIDIQLSVAGPFKGFKLKDMGKMIGYQWRHPDLDGLEVGAQYTSYLLDRKEPDWNRLLEYNEDDVMAVKRVVKWLNSLLI